MFMLTHLAGFGAGGKSVVAVAGATGTAIGDMNAVGALSNAFDGVAEASTDADRVQKTNSDTGFVGKDWGAGSTKEVTKVEMLGTSNLGFCEQRTNVTIEIRGHSSAPSAGTEGTLLGTTGSIADTTSLVTVNVATPQAFRYVWAYLSASGGSLGHIYMGDMTIYEQV